LLNVLFRGGLRREEIIVLDIKHYQFSDKNLKVVGKGGHHRLVPLHSKTIDALEQWIAVRGDQDGPLFIGFDTQGNLRDDTDTRMSPSGIYDIVVRRGKRAGLKHISPHDMRRTCLTTLLDSDVDIGTVASIAGHVSVDTTRIYDRRQDQRNAKAIDNLDF
jgi:integrase